MNTTDRLDLVISGGTVVDASWSGVADVWVRQERIVAVVAAGTEPPGGTDRVIDATGKLVMPGGVDAHCHVGYTSGEYTSRDGYRECTIAAVFGGTTTIVDFAIPSPGEVPLEVARRQRALAGDGVCDSALHASVVEWDDTTEEQLRTLVDEGIVTVKMFTTYRDETMASADTILRTMRALRELGGMAVVHCEDNSIIEEDQRRSAARGEIDAAHMGTTRSELAETAAVAEVIALAESIDAPVYFVHQSTPAAVGLSADARRRGVKVYTEAVAHHLTLDAGLYDGDDPERWVCCPPLRPADRVAGLGELLTRGEITTVSSDHCCYDLRQKEAHTHDVREMPNGLPGVETRLPMVFSRFVAEGGLDPRKFVELTATNPAKVNGIHPTKGALMPGSDADIAIWDASTRWTITADTLHMATDYTPYEGIEVSGRPETVIVRGTVVVHDGALVESGARGRHVPAGRLDPDAWLV
ncbi:dihydropyrimidinase [Curtobacterium sp. ZW137]|uniref:dihydropyrimidinase n=1 Tax=Curtobacterium sp. ZW137 TaxID=2485104 RepID=UPI000F4BD875|nr:dihydropyrimidinase [Curtobacterium sp. ZW137]ROP65620.1 dihydropyrimidinase [Curtobacterium sp. ZW137]